MDPMVISMIASAVLGYQKNKEQQQNYADNQKVEATKEKFSGFNGVQGQNLGRPSQVDPIFQSLIAGAMMGQNLKKAGYGKDDGGATVDPGSKGDPNSASFVGPPAGLAGPTTSNQPMAVIGTNGTQKPATMAANGQYSDYYRGPGNGGG